MCIRDSLWLVAGLTAIVQVYLGKDYYVSAWKALKNRTANMAVSYTHLRAHETVLDLVCRLLLEKKQTSIYTPLHTLSSNTQTYRTSITLSTYRL